MRRCGRSGWKSAAGGLAVGLGCGLAGPGAWAQPAESGRYSMSPAEGGVIRLDRETGAMSFCSGKDGEWSCKPMADTESELKRKADALDADKRAREAERRLREGLFGSLSPRSGQPGTDAPAAPDETLPPAPPADLPIPNERDVDKVFDYVEGMVRKLRERIDRLEREAQKEPDVPL